jgi:hypothetical protein
MVKLKDLSDDNFILYASSNYNNPHYLTSEFQEDIIRIKYVKRLLKKYRLTKEIKERLVLNHIIILANMFGVEAIVNILFFKVDKEDYTTLKTFLLYLNYMPSQLNITFNKQFINNRDIGVDLELAKKLREI